MAAITAGVCSQTDVSRRQNAGRQNSVCSNVSKGDGARMRLMATASAKLPTCRHQCDTAATSENSSLIGLLRIEVHDSVLAMSMNHADRSQDIHDSTIDVMEVSKWMSERPLDGC